MRAPFCDRRFVEYTCNMPWSIEALDGREKGVLRKAFEGLLPNEIVWRKKSPYPKTMNPVYFERVKQKLFGVLEGNSPIGNCWIWHISGSLQSTQSKSPNRGMDSLCALRRFSPTSTGVPSGCNAIMSV